MKVTAIMTVKNGQKFIEQALDSIISQAAPVAEIIVVDDGSTDSSAACVRNIASRVDIPIKLICTTGVGRAKALNIAVDASAGDWIANIDVDDYWYIDKLRLQLDAIQKHPECDIFVTGTHIIYGSKAVDRSRRFEASSVVTLDKCSFFINNPINHSSVLISKAALKEVGGYCADLARQIDIELWVRLLVAGYRFGMLQQPLTVKRLHEEQSFEHGNRFRYALGAFVISLKKLSALNAPAYYYPVPFIKFLYQILPRGISNAVRKVVRATT